MIDLNNDTDELNLNELDIVTGSGAIGDAAAFAACVGRWVAREYRHDAVDVGPAA